MSAGHPALLRNRRELASGLFTFTLDPPDTVRGTFHTPGQYHRLSVAGVGESYFALASAPSASSFEYLARTGSDVADALVEGAEVSISELVGPGFPLHRARGQSLLMVATGTGIAPIRSVIHTLLADRGQVGRVQVVYGARTPAELAFSSEYEAWVTAGLELHLTVTAKHAGWVGEVGRVQARLAALVFDDPTVFLCGQSAMESEVAEILQENGVIPAKIFLNH